MPVVWKHQFRRSIFVVLPWLFLPAFRVVPDVNFAIVTARNKHLFLTWVPFNTGHLLLVKVDWIYSRLRHTKVPNTNRSRLFAGSHNQVRINVIESCAVELIFRWAALKRAFVTIVPQIPNLEEPVRPCCYKMVGVNWRELCIIDLVVFMRIHKLHQLVFISMWHLFSLSAICSVNVPDADVVAGCTCQEIICTLAPIQAKCLFMQAMQFSDEWAIRLSFMSMPIPFECICFVEINNPAGRHRRNHAAVFRILPALHHFAFMRDFNDGLELAMGLPV